MKHRPLVLLAIIPCLALAEEAEEAEEAEKKVPPIIEEVIVLAHPLARDGLAQPRGRGGGHESFPPARRPRRPV